MPITFGFTLSEGKVYRSKKKTDEDEEKQALRELQSILSAKHRKACDCEAQVHDLLENCLNCGRLTCELEGPGKCLSCGNLVLSEDQRQRFKKHIDIQHPVDPRGDTSGNKGPRTKIIDNQFDHFAIDNKKHLREDERKKLREDLDDLQAIRFKRNLILDIDVEQLEAGSRSAPKVDDYEAALRDLQLDNNNQEFDSEFTLAELVRKEAKSKHNYEYVDYKQMAKTVKKPDPATEGVTIMLNGEQPPTTKQPITSSRRNNFRGFNQMPSTSEHRYPKPQQPRSSRSSRGPKRLASGPSSNKNPSNKHRK